MHRTTSAGLDANGGNVNGFSEGEAAQSLSSATSKITPVHSTKPCERGVAGQQLAGVIASTRGVDTVETWHADGL
ncbi:MAG TPA: hypothetical protein VJU59_19130 [Paraburkholderia sp.]|uniref:hypothetical protein n=1 Tax=Paraburkholderia sp. TaxID=1926495 RepID=UPI002B49699B|nr:hypothetical protein [Paraburkholderia sp.]HKR41754.1 hypothetical protein [Paraburkholderia sp.]